MNRTKKNQIDYGWVDIPKDYPTFSDKQKKAICNKLIDTLLTEIDKELDPTINRITFLNEVFESSIITNEELELYEVCQVLRDCRNSLNDN